MNKQDLMIDISEDVITCPYADACSDDLEEFNARATVGGSEIYESVVYVLFSHSPEDGKLTMNAESKRDYIARAEMENRQNTQHLVENLLEIDPEHVVTDYCVRCTHKKKTDTTVRNCAQWTHERLQHLDPDYIVTFGEEAMLQIDSRWRFGDITEDHACFQSVEDIDDKTNAFHAWKDFGYEHLPTGATIA